MAKSEIVDKRLLERSVRKGELAVEQAEKQAAAADYTDEVTGPSDEEIEELREALANEKVVRDQRIERSIAEPAKRPTPVVPVTPLLEEDL